ncbi:MAG: PHP domain-containing protein [Negativicutes bacterium]|nr:PHP domain-containing protein [Negativicutes bacterium]
MIADLHIHTNASDGRLSPAEIVREAEKAGLSHIAITDHDTVAGLDGLHEQNSSLTIIPGVELNTDLPGHEVHILGYYIDIKNERLQDELGKMAADRLTRTQKMVRKLNELGYAIQYERVQEIAGNAVSIGRPHIAKALHEKHYFSGFDEIFATVLNTNSPAYVPHYKLLPEAAIQLIILAKGIPVLAHPGLIGSNRIVSAMIEAGVQGIEVYHPKHSEQQTNKWLALAKRHSLLVTGGSDYHAIPDRYPSKLGLFTVPSTIALNLQQAARH